ncbi:class I tRNA ligase family protein, partial [Patescibacteria group bacterium]|nr:class I tRNA ligase family protein [Patescibacteria group bacterium]
WNISRQIWYGHRVPVWYKSDEVYVGVEEPDGKGWQQDKDTLDTWFSSGLWTFSTLGWPQGSEDLETYHPTDVLETGYDILFFWVARMILMTTYALGEIPFEHVYLHGLIRDEKGRKMSKSLGNVIDPLDMIKKYGADATRLSLVIGSTPGNDMKFSKEKVAGFKNFTNKLWNIARFVFVSVGNVESVGNVKGETLADRWVLGRFSEVVEKVTRHLEKFEYSLAGEALRDFTWGEFADWYIEIAKVKSQKSKVATDKILLYILERLLILWHPFMPFVSEEIYKRFDRGMLIVAPWPDVGTAFMPSDEDKRTFEDLRGVIISIRNIRARYKIDPKKKLDATIVSGGYLEDQSEIIQALAKVENLTFDDKAKKPEGSASAVVGQIQIYVPLVGIVDLEQEKAKLEKELASTEQYAASLEKKLADKAFLKKAPKEVVRQEKEKLQNAKVHITLLETEINSLS